MLVNVAALLGDGRIHRRPQVVHHLGHHFGVQRLRHGGEAGDVGEQHRSLLAPLFGLGGVGLQGGQLLAQGGQRRLNDTVTEDGPLGLQSGHTRLQLGDFVRHCLHARSSRAKRAAIIVEKRQKRSSGAG